MECKRLWQEKHYMIREVINKILRLLSGSYQKWKHLLTHCSKGTRIKKKYLFIIDVSFRTDFTCGSWMWRDRLKSHDFIFNKSQLSSFAFPGKNKTKENPFLYSPPINNWRKIHVFIGSQYKQYTLDEIEVFFRIENKESLQSERRREGKNEHEFIIQLYTAVWEPMGKDSGLSKICTSSHSGIISIIWQLITEISVGPTMQPCDIISRMRKLQSYISALNKPWASRGWKVLKMTIS